MPEANPGQVRIDHMTWRHWLLAGLIGLGLVALFVRLAQIQIADHERYAAAAASSRLGAAVLPAPRGAILDATGFPLASSVDTWDLYVDSALWRDRDRARAAAGAVAAELGLDAGALFARGTARETGDALIRRWLEYEQGLALRERGLWGVRLLPSSRRVYAEGDLAGPLIGYVGLDGAGLWGIEADFDHVLRGRPGLLQAEQDPLGRPIAFAPAGGRAPQSGGEVQLTIDRFIQAIAERRLAEAVAEHRATGGTVIVMEPHTGAVLAMASLPAVRLSAVDFADEGLGELVRNRAVTNVYEPGSVFKTLTVAAAIDLGLVTPLTTYDDRGAVDIGGAVIRNWDFAAHGRVTMTEYLQRSLNTGAVWLSGLIGAERFYGYLDRFGVAQPTHVGLSGEAQGLMRRPEDIGWYPIDLATNSYGQGLAATPLQVAAAINVFANGGALMQPQIVRRIVTSEGARELQPVTVRQAVSHATAGTLARMMLDVVEGVPRHRARVPGYRVAGKTGTTLVSIPTGYDLDTTIASFAGFLPYEDPRVTVLVKIDRPEGESNLGGVVAAPVFSVIAADIMQYLNVPSGARRVEAP